MEVTNLFQPRICYSTWDQKRRQKQKSKTNNEEQPPLAILVQPDVDDTEGGALITMEGLETEEVPNSQVTKD